MFKVLLNIQIKCKNAIPDRNEHKSFHKQRDLKQFFYKAREKITSGSPLCKDRPLAQRRSLLYRCGWIYNVCYLFFCNDPL